MVLMAPSNFLKSQVNGDGHVQRCKCGRKCGIWLAVIYKVLTCLSQSQHLRIPRQPLDHSHPAHLGQAGREQPIRDSPGAGGMCTCSFPGFGSLDRPTLQWPQYGFDMSVLLILNTREFWVCGFMTKQVQVRLSFLFAGKLPSSIFKW